MSGRWQRWSWLALGMAVAAFVVVSSGLVNVGASSGHWPVTAWLLHYTMRRSVVTRSLGIREPPLDDPALIVRGAGHYASGCAPCHGEPGAPRGPIVRQMTPQAPDFDPEFASWRPRELFWIVKHGIKYTAMPAWTAPDRDDEIWAIVAFLRRLPELTPGDYRALAYGESSDPGNAGIDALGDDDPVLGDCIRCHGRDGTGRGLGAFPRLDILSEEYLFAALVSYAEGTRPSGIMQPLAQTLDRPTIRRLARHYADAAPARESSPRIASVNRDNAGHFAARGAPEQGVPACTHCHGPEAVADNPLFPRLAGQHRGYLVTQLQLFRNGVRGGGPFAGLMHEVANGLEHAQIEAVAEWYASLPDGTAQ